MDNLHPLGKVINHLSMQHTYFLLFLAAVSTADINITEIKGFFHLHSAFNAIACQKCNGNHKMINQIPERILTQSPHFFTAQWFE